MKNTARNIYVTARRCGYRPAWYFMFAPWLPWVWTCWNA